MAEVLVGEKDPKKIQLKEVLVNEKDPKKIQELIGEKGPSCRHLLGETDPEKASRHLFSLLDEPEQLAALAVKFKLCGEEEEDLAWLRDPFATSRKVPTALADTDAPIGKPTPVDYYKVALHPKLLLDANMVNSILLSVASRACRDTVETETVVAIVDSEWKKVWRHYLLFILFRALKLSAALLCAHSYREGKTPHAVGLTVLWLDLISWILFELLELQSLYRVCSWMSKDESHQAVGIKTICWKRALLVVLLIACYRIPAVLALSGLHFSESKAYIAVDIGFRCFSLLYSFRGLQPVGPRLLPILFAVIDTKLFLSVLLFSLLTSTSVYWAMGARDAFMIIFRLALMGDFDMLEIQGLHFSGCIHQN